MVVPIDLTTMLRRSWLALVFGALLVLSPNARAQCGEQWLPGESIPGVNGIVYATVNWDPDGAGPKPTCLVVGGNFDVAGDVFASAIALFDPESGRWSPLGSGVSGNPSRIVYSLAVDAHGHLIVGGRFLHAGGVSARGIARWDGSAWFPMGDLNGGPVFAMAVLPNGDLVAGGRFSSAGAMNTNNIARWDGLRWNALDRGLSQEVNSLAVLPTGELVAAGSFWLGPGILQSVATWNGSVWSPLGGGLSLEGGFGTRALSLAVLPNGDLIVGGNFSAAGNVPANNIVRWNGSAWSPLGSGISGGQRPEVRGIVTLPNGDLMVAGTFKSAGGVPASNAARWNGTSWSSLGAGTSDIVHTLTLLPDGDVLAGGMFTAVDGKGMSFLARWSGSAWKPFTPDQGVTGSLSDLEVLPNGDLIAGGIIRSAGSANARGIAHWNGSTWSALGSGLGGLGSFDVLLLPDGDLIVGGSFEFAGENRANRIARWNGTAWSPLGTGVDNAVTSLQLLPNADILAAGRFTTAGDAPANNIARWNGAVWSPLGSGTNGSIYDIDALPDGDVIAGGDFSVAGGQPASRIARWDGSSWLPMGSGMSGPSSSWVYSLLRMPNGSLLAGGSFTTAGGTPANNIALWNGQTWSPFAPGLELSVSDLAILPNGDLVAVGGITTSGANPFNGIARWNGSMWSPFGSGTNGGGIVVTPLPNGELAVGGYFTTAGGHPNANFARYSFTGIPTMSVHPEPATIDAGQTLVLSAIPSNGYSNVSARWYKDGAPINDGPAGASPNGGTVTGSSFTLPSPTRVSNAVLIIDSARRSDAGQYTVVFSNPCGSIASNAATVTIRPDCPADLNNDGATDLADFFEFYHCYDTQQPCADIDETPGTDLADFFLFFASYDAGC